VIRTIGICKLSHFASECVDKTGDIPFNLAHTAIVLKGVQTAI